MRQTATNFQTVEPSTSFLFDRNKETLDAQIPEDFAYSDRGTGLPRPYVPLELGQRLSICLGARRIVPVVGCNGEAEYAFYMRDSASPQPARYIASCNGDMLKMRSDNGTHTLEFQGAGYRKRYAESSMEIAFSAIDRDRVVLRSDDGSEYGLHSGTIVYASPAMRSALVLLANEDE